jgi:DNA-binding NarL/FixJ family response regulator
VATTFDKQHAGHSMLVDVRPEHTADELVRAAEERFQRELPVGGVESAIERVERSTSLMRQALELRDLASGVRQEAILELRAAGWSLAKIAAATGLSAATVQQGKTWPGASTVQAARAKLRSTADLEL